jgi:hypothetical protein
MSVSDFLLRKSGQFTTFLEPEGYGGRIIEVDEVGKHPGVATTTLNSNVAAPSPALQVRTTTPLNP